MIQSLFKKLVFYYKQDVNEQINSPIHKQYKSKKTEISSPVEIEIKKVKYYSCKNIQVKRQRSFCSSQLEESTRIQNLDYEISLIPEVPLIQEISQVEQIVEKQTEVVKQEPKQLKTKKIRQEEQPKVQEVNKGVSNGQKSKDKEDLRKIYKIKQQDTDKQIIELVEPQVADDWVEISLKKIPLSRTIEQPQIQIKKNLLTEEEEIEVKAFKLQLKERVQKKLSEVEDKAHSNMVKNVAGYRVKKETEIINKEIASEVQQLIKTQEPFQTQTQPEQPVPIQTKTSNVPTNATQAPIKNEKSIVKELVVKEKLNEKSIDPLTKTNIDVAQTTKIVEVQAASVQKIQLKIVELPVIQVQKDNKTKSIDQPYFENQAKAIENEVGTHFFGKLRRNQKHPNAATVPDQFTVAPSKTQNEGPYKAKEDSTSQKSEVQKPIVEQSTPQKSETYKPIVESPPQKSETQKLIVESTSQKSETYKPIVESTSQKSETYKPIVESPPQKSETQKPIVESTSQKSENQKHIAVSTEKIEVKQANVELKTETSIYNKNQSQKYRPIEQDKYEQKPEQLKYQIKDSTDKNINNQNKSIYVEKKIQDQSPIKVDCIKTQDLNVIIENKEEIATNLHKIEQQLPQETQEIVLENKEPQEIYDTKTNLIPIEQIEQIIIKSDIIPQDQDNQNQQIKEQVEKLNEPHEQIVDQNQNQSTNKNYDQIHPQAEEKILDNFLNELIIPHETSDAIMDNFSIKLLTPPFITHVNELSPNLAYNDQLLSRSFGEVSNQLTDSMEERLQLLRQSVVVEFLNHPILTLETMIMVIDNAADIMKERYSDFVKQMRKDRRQLLLEKNFEEYIQTLLQMTSELQDMLQETYYLVSAALDITEDSFIQSYVYYANLHGEEGEEERVLNEEEKDNQTQFLERITYVQQELKESIKSKVPLLKNKGKEVIRYQLRIIQNVNEFDVIKYILPNFKHSVEQQQLLPTILNYAIEDILYEKFKIEEEDKIKFLKSNRNDQELIELQRSLDAEATAHFEFQLQE